MTTCRQRSSARDCLRLTRSCHLLRDRRQLSDNHRRITMLASAMLELLWRLWEGQSLVGGESITLGPSMKQSGGRYSRSSERQGSSLATRSRESQEPMALSAQERIPQLD